MEENAVQGVRSKEYNDRVRLGTIAGLPLFFNYSFLLLFLFLFFVKPINLLLFISLLFFSITVHELSHALASRYLGLGNGTLTIWFLGGFFIPFNEEFIIHMSTKQRVKYAFMVLAGPLSNIVLYGIFVLLAYVTSMDMLYSAAKYNLFLAFINLLPVGYLDGGNIIRYLGSIVVDWRKITRLSGFFSISLAIIVFVSSFFTSWLNRYSSWGGFLIGMGVGAISMSRKSNEELQAESKKTINREIALTRLTDQNNESKGFISVIIKVGLIAIVFFSTGYLIKQYLLYKDLSGHILYTDFNKSDRELRFFITQKLGFPTKIAEGNYYPERADQKPTIGVKIIAFICISSSGNGTYSICVDDLNGNLISEIPLNIKKISKLTLSPDGTKIAISPHLGGIYIADIKTKEVELIYDAGFVETWSPSGDAILLTDTLYGTGEIFRLSDQGEKVENLTNNFVDDMSPVYSADGQYIYFVSSRYDELELFRMDSDGSNVVMVDLEIGIDSKPDIRLSPDNLYIAYQCKSFGEWICVAEINGTWERILSKGHSPVWSPDGKYLAFSGDVRDMGIYIISVKGEKMITLKSPNVYIYDLAWLP